MISKMPGTDTTEYKMLRLSLVNFYEALKRHIPGIKFDDLFFEVFGCYETDDVILGKTDFGRYHGSIPIVSGLPKAIVDLG